MKIFLLILPVWLLSVSYAGAQKRDEALERLNQGKDFLSIGKSGLAMQTLDPLLNPYPGNHYPEYAGFFYAIAAYRDGQLSLALEKMRTLYQRAPSWEKRDEVALWMTQLCVESGNYSEAFSAAKDLHNPELQKKAQQLVVAVLEKKNSSELKALLGIYPGEKSIATALANQISTLPAREQDLSLLDNLIEVYQLDRELYLPEALFQTEKKSEYHVAVLLPFMIEELKSQPGRVANPFVVELFNGLRMGVDELLGQNIRLRLHPYDTQRSGRTTSSILGLPEMKHMDLIIGPLYPEPVQRTTEFSASYRINMINPLSGNTEIIANNPFAFLFMPTAQTMGRRTAEFCAPQTSRKKAIALYEPTERDSTLAANFSGVLEEEGFEVLYTGPVNSDRAGKIIRQLGGASVELELSDYRRASDPAGQLRPDQVKVFRIPTEQIGLVLLATDQAAIVAGALSSLTSRSDSILLVGKTEWLQSRVISLESLEKIGAQLIGRMHFPFHEPEVRAFAEAFEKQNKTLSTENALIGYELGLCMGRLLRDGGNLFQYDPDYPFPLCRTLGSGFKPGQMRDNDKVPIMMIREGDLVQINRP